MHNKDSYKHLRAPRLGRPFYDLAAAAVVVAATTVVIIGNAVVATAAEQDQQDDDPAHIPATETIVIHRKYLRKISSRHLPLIPRYSPA